LDLTPAQIRQLHTFHNLTLGAVYLQTAWDKAHWAKFADPGRAVARLLSQPVQLGLLLLAPDDNVGWTVFPETCTANQLKHYSLEDIVGMGARIRAELPVLPDPQARRISTLTTQVSALTAQVAALKTELVEAKEDDAKLRAHLSDAHEEAAGLRRRCNRLQEQLDECDCEE